MTPGYVKLVIKAKQDRHTQCISALSLMHSLKVAGHTSVLKVGLLRVPVHSL